MADEQSAPEAIAGGGSKLKTIVVVAALLAVEAGAIVGAMKFLGAGPDSAEAKSEELDPALAELEKIVEVEVLDGKLPNAATGVSYLYNTEIYVQVKNKHAAEVTGTVEQFYNEIKAEITAIWRTSEPQHFQEPKLGTLTRKVRAMLHERLGEDEDTGEPVALKCVIVMGTGFRIDR